MACAPSQTSSTRLQERAWLAFLGGAVVVALLALLATGLVEHEHHPPWDPSPAALTALTNDSDSSPELDDAVDVPGAALLLVGAWHHGVEMATPEGPSLADGYRSAQCRPWPTGPPQA